ncbi:MarR family transcriptional regulator [Paenibacillus sp. IB182496]|uniref:MarR family transcriptional regulator n=1 Tax=Paenibacillus sabuli TaxID=2772509 RepID=A0A927BWE8_9BACL|nr:MarR family transcriptional regulator [Paenibacillus sabuli]MBD2846739.1 MarR family transcriptional regulator [Paenibacillus sabuli]
MQPDPHTPSCNSRDAHAYHEEAHAETVLLEQQLCFTVYAVSREITKLYQPLLKALNLTYTQYITMLVLWELRETTMKALGERLLLDSGTLTPLLKKLETQGLVTRRRDRRDERSLQVVVTEAGLALQEKARHIPECLLQMVGGTPEAADDLRLRLSAALDILRNREPIINNVNDV